MRPLKVVFDLDETIVLAFDSPGDTLDELKKHYPYLSEFQKHGLLIHAIIWHIVFPGVIELIRLLHLNHIRIGFFSSGTKDRNELLVDQLMEIAVGEQEYRKIAPITKVLSRSDLDNINRDNDSFLVREFGTSCSILCKNLTKFLDPDLLLEDIILVDDNSYYSHAAQIKNMLYALAGFNQSVISHVFNGLLEPLFFHKANIVFYVAGLIFQSMFKANNEGLSFSEALFQLQFRKTNELTDDRRFIYKRDKLDDNAKKEIIQYGFLLLVTMNNTLCLVQAGQLFSPHYQSNIPVIYFIHSLMRELSERESEERKKIELSEYKLSRLFQEISRLSHQRHEIISIEEQERISLVERRIEGVRWFYRRQQIPTMNEMYRRRFLGFM